MAATRTEGKAGGTVKVRASKATPVRFVPTAKLDASQVKDRRKMDPAPRPRPGSPPPKSLVRQPTRRPGPSWRRA